MPNSIQNAPAKSTEGQKAGQPLTGQQKQRGASNQAGNRRGRPPGSKNKPKGIMPVELADTILLHMQGMLPPEHFDYMKGVIREGKAISTKTELDTLIILLSRNLFPALVLEAIPGGGEEEDTDESVSKAEKAVNKALKMPIFRKDVTERLKVLQSLLALKNQLEKRETESRDEDKPIIRIAAGRGIDGERVRLLIGIESSPVAGNSDGNGQPADEAGTVPDQVPERPELLPTSEQGPSDRVLDGDSSGGSVQRLHSGLLQG
jgi:hypothetical protein